MSRLRSLCLAALVALAAVSLTARPVALAGDGGEKIETADYDVRVPKGFEKAAAAPASVLSSAVVLESPKHVKLLLGVLVIPADELADTRKEFDERPTSIAASFVMPMALKAGGPAITVYDEVTLGGEPAPAVRILATPRAGKFASFHAAARMLGDRIFLVAVLTGGDQGANAVIDPDHDQIEATLEAYEAARALKVKGR